MSANGFRWTTRPSILFERGQVRQSSNEGEGVRQQVINKRLKYRSQRKGGHGFPSILERGDLGPHVVPGGQEDQLGFLKPPSVASCGPGGCLKHPHPGSV